MFKRIILVSFITYMMSCCSCFAAKKISDTEIIKLVVVKEEAKDGLGKKIPYREITKPYISGNYALTTIIFIEGASQIILEKRNGKWKIIGGGGGAFGKQGLLEYGVPLKNAENIMRQQKKALKKK